jgi:hypothetical protein
MTVFLRLLAEKDKASELLAASATLRAGATDSHVFHVQPESFRAVPGAPFAYWVSECVRSAFKKISNCLGTPVWGQANWRDWIRVLES